MKKYLIGFLGGLMLALPVFAFAAPTIAERMKNRVLLQVESKGEAWFVKDNGTRVYIGTPLAAWEILRKFASGITDKDLAEIPLADEAYTMNEEVSRGYQSFVKKETVYVDRVIEKPVEKIIYVEKTTGSVIPKEETLGMEVVKPTPTFSAERGRDKELIFKATGDNFIIEAVSVSTVKPQGTVYLGNLQLRECSNLNLIWLEYSGISYPIECATQGYFQTDWFGRKRTDAIKVSDKQTYETSLTDNGVIKYIRAVGENTGTVVILRDI